MANPEQPSKNAGGYTRFPFRQGDFDVMQFHFFTNRWSSITVSFKAATIIYFAKPHLSNSEP
jgi:hypothetical protein